MTSPDAVRVLFEALERAAPQVLPDWVEGPASEQTVIVMLAQLMSRTGGVVRYAGGSGAFPDMHLHVGGRVLRVEVEQTTADFIRHGHPVADVDAVICWRETISLPVPVLALCRLLPGLKEPRVSAIDMEAKHPALVTIHLAVRRIFEEYGCHGDAWGAKGQRQTERFLPPSGTKAIAAAQYSGGGSNEYLRLRFYVDACAALGVDRAALQRIRDGMTALPTVRCGSNLNEEYVDVFPDVADRIIALESWLDSGLRSFGFRRTE